MTDETPNQPDLYAYAVREIGRKSYFTKIGAVFAHAKGGGLTVDLDALPIERKMVLFPPREEETAEPETP